MCSGLGDRQNANSGNRGALRRVGWLRRRHNQKGMEGLQGQPIGAAIAKLGIPNDEREIAGQKVYTWYSSTFDEGTQLQCKIRVMMAGDVIGGYEFDGNNNMCMRYAAKLRS